MLCVLHACMSQCHGSESTFLVCCMHARAYAMAVSLHAVCAACMYESSYAGKQQIYTACIVDRKTDLCVKRPPVSCTSPSRLCCPSFGSKDSGCVPPCRRPRSHWYACSSATRLSWRQGRSHWSSATQSPSPPRTASLSGPSRTRKHRGRQHMLTGRTQHTHGIASFLCGCCLYGRVGECCLVLGLLRELCVPVPILGGPSQRHHSRRTV